MQIPILIEPLVGNGFRARSGEPFALTAEGSTREEALQKLQQLINDRRAAGAEVVALEIGPHRLPPPPFAGRQADPLLEEWKRAKAEYRQQVEDDPNYL